MDTTPSGKMKENLKNIKHSDFSSEDSPSYFPLTQDSLEGIDVMWDWNSSPQAEKKPRRRKRLLTTSSPKVPIKRHPSFNRNFDKLKGELEALKDQLAAIPDEECLSVSPMHECDFKKDSLIETNNLDDLFDDSVDQQLVLFTQQIEDRLNNINNNEISSKLPENNGINKSNKNKIEDLNDSLDSILGAIKDDTFESLFQKKQPQTNNSEALKINNYLLKSEMSRGKSFEIVENKKEVACKFNRTKSFEQQTNSKETLTKINLEEIERKRKEALAKLELKRKKQGNLEAQKTVPPKKCSLEEIEQKRLQAVAKLKEKRMQEMVEKKRQEALKRLEKTRMRRFQNS